MYVCRWLLLMPTAAALLLHHLLVSTTTKRFVTMATTRRVIVLAGPTAVGKSAVAQRLARMMDGRVELVIADSVQVYRGMNIGANKPTRGEMEAIPHHMVDICDPRDNLSAGDFVNMATPLILSILERGNTPLVVGGSTMWIQWLVKGIPDAPRASEFALQEAERLIGDLQRSNQWEEAYKISAPFDYRIEKLARNDWYRLRRYLEVALTLNVDKGAPSISLTGKRYRQMLQDIDVRCFFLAEKREELYHIIDSRCDEMLLQDTVIPVMRPNQVGGDTEFRKGLFGEVVKLLLNGSLCSDTPVSKAIGYRQVISYLCAEEYKAQNMDALKEFLESFRTVTRNYARKQINWYRKDDSFLWLEMDRSRFSAVEAYDNCAREILHWMSAESEEFYSVIQKQITLGQVVGKLKRDKKVIKNLGKPEFDDSAFDENHLLAKQFLVGAIQRAPVESSWTAHGIGLRACETANSKALREYEAKSSLSSEQLLELLAEADSCADLIRESGIGVEFRKDFCSPAAKDDTAGEAGSADENNLK